MPLNFTEKQIEEAKKQIEQSIRDVGKQFLTKKQTERLVKKLKDIKKR